MSENNCSINGVINIHKEKGFTSHDVVAKLRGILRIRKIGHTGTLDPDATGVLPVCIGKATRLCDMIGDWDKSYRAVMLLGVETDTEDISGNITSESSVNVTESQIREIIHSFVGPYAQVPPMYSAKKIKGKKLYELAREGVVLTLPPCDVEIFSIDIISIDLPRVTFQVHCSKGTYIRSLCRDIGRKAGCGACMESLIRTNVAHFTLDHALTLQEVEMLRDQDRLWEYIQPIDEMFLEYPAIKTDRQCEKHLYNGNPVADDYCCFIGNSAQKAQGNHLYRLYDHRYHFIGVYRYHVKQRLYKPEKLFFDMTTMKYINNTDFKLQNTAIALGKFESIHLGHQLLIEQVLEQKANGLKATVFTFDKPPLAVIRHDDSIQQIYTKEERKELLAKLGLDILIEHPFTEEFMNLTPEKFIKDVLVEKAGAKVIVVGKDFHFAKNRSGDVNILQDMAEECGYQLIVFDKMEIDQDIVSSTRIRELIANADMEEAAKLLGRPYTVIGEVVYGNQLGRKTFGTPTANQIVPAGKIIPPHGVYVSRINVDGKVYHGITNVGVKPTIEDRKIKGVETNIFDFDEDIYGKVIEVELLHFCRKEMKFASFNDLCEQMKQDKLNARQYFIEHK